MYKTEDRPISAKDVVIALKTSASRGFIKGELYLASRVVGSIVRVNKDSNGEVNGWDLSNFKPVKTEEITGDLNYYVGEKAIIVNNNNGASDVSVGDIVKLGRQSYSGFKCHENRCNHINFKNLRVIVKEESEDRIKYPTIREAFNMNGNSVSEFRKIPIGTKIKVIHNESEEYLNGSIFTFIGNRHWDSKGKSTTQTYLNTRDTIIEVIHKPNEVKLEDITAPFITSPVKPIVIKELSMKKENKIPKNFYRVFTNDGKAVNPRGVVEQDARAARGRRGSDTRPFVREIIKKETTRVAELIKELDIAALKEEAKDKYDIELSYILNQLEIYQKYLKQVEDSDNKFIVIGNHYNASINTAHFYRLQQLLKNPVKYDWVEEELTYELVSKNAVTLFKSKKFIIDVVNGQIKLTKIKADLTMTVDIKHNSETNKFYL
jgi:hypothetical protein